MTIADRGNWLRHLLPLPHQIDIEEVVECHPGDVRVRVRDGAGEIGARAAAELTELLGGPAPARPARPGFRILIGVLDSQGQLGDAPVDISRLEALPNREQAYLIQPHGRDQLLLCGLHERGVSYAIRTLYQLLEASLTDDRVCIPLMRVLDWPDMDERGLWNFPDPEQWIPWLASLKLNYGKMASTELARVETGIPNRATIDVGWHRRAQQLGFNYVPYILHLNFLEDIGLFQAYPELAGKGDGALSGRYFAHKRGSQHRVPCASNPLLVDILTEWMDDIARQGAGEISCWLSERPAQCGCIDCTATGQFVLESRAFVGAWQQARQRHPDLQIRIFSSTTTSERNYRVLAELPAEVRFERACATELERVRHLPRDLFANPLLDHCAARGRWIASYDVPLGANGRVDTPEFKVPHRSAHRIRDYVGQLIARSYSGAYGMMAWGTQGREICGYNIQALAEWSWNLHGRTEREFTVAWATREGYRDPEVVAEWAELMGPVEFDVYDSDFPICYSWGQAVDMVRQRRRPSLGEGMFRYYLDPGEFDRKKAVCMRALELARSFEDPDPALATALVLSYVELARCLYVVAERVALAEVDDPEVQPALRAAAEELADAGAANVAAIEAWRRGLGPEPWHYRVHDAIKGTEDTVREICDEIQ